MPNSRPLPGLGSYRGSKRWGQGREEDGARGVARRVGPDDSRFAANSSRRWRRACGCGEPPASCSSSAASAARSLLVNKPARGSGGLRAKPNLPVRSVLPARAACRVVPSRRGGRRRVRVAHPGDRGDQTPDRPCSATGSASKAAGLTVPFFGPAKAGVFRPLCGGLVRHPSLASSPR